jgi:hypothetical protein
MIAAAAVAVGVVLGYWSSAGSGLLAALAGLLPPVVWQVAAGLGGSDARRGRLAAAETAFAPRVVEVQGGTDSSGAQAAAWRGTSGLRRRWSGSGHAGTGGADWVGGGQGAGRPPRARISCNVASLSRGDRSLCIRRSPDPDAVRCGPGQSLQVADRRARPTPGVARDPPSCVARPAYAMVAEMDPSRATARSASPSLIEVSSWLAEGKGVRRSSKQWEQTCTQRSRIGVVGNVDGACSFN